MALQDDILLMCRCRPHIHPHSFALRLLLGVSHLLNRRKRSDPLPLIVGQEPGCSDPFVLAVCPLEWLRTGSQGSTPTCRFQEELCPASLFKQACLPAPLAAPPMCWRHGWGGAASIPRRPAAGVSALTHCVQGESIVPACTAGERCSL